MGMGTRFERMFGRGKARARGAEEPVAPANARSTAPREVINDARAYGVAVEPAAVEPGGWYWQAVRVHHLAPEENNGNHHIYFDLRDPSLSEPAADTGPDGPRVYNARARVTWDGGEQTVVIDKPANEPGGNFPMWKWQVCAMQALGLPGAELPSDRVTGIHTGHPDEATGNTLFHHSFIVTFVKVQAPATVYRDSVIYGVIRNAAGRNALLLRGETTIAGQPVAADEAFRFVDLPAGEYVVAVDGAALRSAPVRVTGADQAQLDLTLTIAESVIAGRVRNGRGRGLDLLAVGAMAASATVADDETYRFAGLPAGQYRVAISGTGVMSEPLALTGTDAATVDLVAPAAGKPLGHYVLFGPRGQPATEANLWLAQDYLQHFRLTFGFDPREAAHAGMVTIIASDDAVNTATEAELAADGTPVERIAGSVEQVAAALAARVANRQAFG
jgi:hypothetical protein